MTSRCLPVEVWRRENDYYKVLKSRSKFRDKSKVQYRWDRFESAEKQLNTKPYQFSFFFYFHGHFSLIGELFDILLFIIFKYYYINIIDFYFRFSFSSFRYLFEFNNICAFT